MSNYEKKDFSAPVPLPLVAGREAAGQGEAAAAPLFFRGLPISWVEVPTTKTVLVTKSAFGEDDTERRTSIRHLIEYNGRQ